MSKFLKIILLSIFLLTALFLFSRLTPPYSIEISPKPQSEKRNRTSIIQLFQPQKNKSAINILCLGRPGQGYPGANLTDTIIIAHLNLKENSSVLISLPRDLLVRNSDKESFAKINSFYNSIGIEGLKQKAEEITALPIDYYISVDLKVVKEIIDLVDGLNVYVPQDINDPYFPGPDYSYQTFALKSGWRYLDGETTLRYIRTRYTSPNGDFDRMARQQQIIRLIKQKVFSLNPLFDFLTYLKIFNSLKERVKTDIGLTKMKYLYQISKEIDSDKITAAVIDKKNTDLLDSGQVMFGEETASAVWPAAGKENYQEIKEYIQKTINK